MNKAKVFAVLVSLLGLVGLIRLLTAHADYPISQLPYEAWQGLAFSLAWGFGVPESIVYWVSALFVATLLVVFFLLGSKFWRCVFSGRRQ